MKLIPPHIATLAKNVLTLLQGRGGMADTSPAGYRVAWGTAWSLVGTVTSRGFTLIGAILVARTMGKEDFGAYGLIQSTIGMFGVFAGLAMGSTMTKYLAEYRRKDPARAGRILVLATNTAFLAGGVAAAALLSSAPWLARSTLKAAELTPVLATGAVLLLVNTFNNVQIGSLSGFEAFRQIAVINVVQGMATPVLGVPLVYFLGVQGGIISLIAVATLGCVLCRAALVRECRKYGIHARLLDRTAFKEWPVLVHFSGPATITGLLVVPVTWFCATILVAQEHGQAQLGLFNAANQWRMVVLFVPQVLGMVMLPVFSEIYGHDDDRAGFTKTLALNLRCTWMIALPATAGVIAIHRPLAALFGAQFVGMAPIIMPLALTCFLFTINNVVGSALTGAGRMWTGALFNAAWAAALIAATWVLAPRFGGLGLAFAYLMAYLLHTLWQMIYVDTRLAPRCVRHQWDLILLTVATLIPAALSSLPLLRSYPIGVVTTAAALVPLGQMVRQWMAKVMSHRGEDGLRKVAE
jgi:O-antigen/teichoic acid export membrane protein